MSATSKHVAAARKELKSLSMLPLSEQEKGWLFEEWLATELHRRGLDDAKWMGAASKTPYDVLSVSSGMRIQAKYTQTRGGSVDVRPSRPVVGSSVRRYKQSDFDFLAIYRAAFDELYFIASSDFECSEFAGMVRGHFRFGEMQEHRNAWWVLFPACGARPIQERQRRLMI